MGLRHSGKQPITTVSDASDVLRPPMRWERWAQLHSGWPTSSQGVSSGDALAERRGRDGLCGSVRVCSHITCTMRVFNTCCSDSANGRTSARLESKKITKLEARRRPMELKNKLGKSYITDALISRIRKVMQQNETLIMCHGHRYGKCG